MNYFISRQGTEYGPYTLGDLQRYVALGNILVTDLARSEGMSDWVPVSQVIGNIPMPMAPAVVRPPQFTLQRERNRLIVPRGTALPRFCVKCGGTPVDPDMQKNFIWLNPLFGLLILGGCVGIIVYMVLYYAMRKQMAFNVPLCEEHRSARQKKLWIGGVLLAASPLLMIIGLVADKDMITGFGAMLFGVMLLAGAIILVLSPPLKPKKIDDLQGSFSGAGEPFLSIIESQATQAARAGY